MTSRSGQRPAQSIFWKWTELHLSWPFWIRETIPWRRKQECPSVCSARLPPPPQLVCQTKHFRCLKNVFFYNRVCSEKKEVRLLFHCFYHFCCTRTSLASQFSTFSSRGLSNARPLVSASSERPLLPAAASAAHLFYHASSMLPCSSTNIFGYVWFQTLARNNTLEIFLYKNNALSRDGFHVVSNVLLRPLKATRSPFIVSNPYDVFWQEQIFKFLQVFLTVNTSFATVFLQNKFNLW